ncbi:tyrosine-type recombinase/integrase [Novipirellula rosea]|uniref:Tyr recombinase domain-containing protein n=1 Tax=Novipirellula rosea TaxID=1031540 RepID=A0ABP8NAU0_9BACT
MAGKPKPFFRKQTQAWYCSIGGRQIRLGKDKDAAEQKFHELMSDRESISSEITTLYDLSQRYLDWVQENRKQGTYDNNLLYLKSFIESIGKRLKVSQLKKHHITKWTGENQHWSDTATNDAIAIVQRMLNWAVEEGYLKYSPLPKVRKPRRQRRDVVYNAQQWKQIKDAATGPLVEFLDFLYWTGCRPKEARIVEKKHVHDDLIIFPADESKGESEPRVIFLSPEPKAIVDRLVAERPEGPLFRNSQGNPWTKDAIKCRLNRMSKVIGFRVIAYGARHSFATNALTTGGVDPISLSHLMGHKDTAMVSRVYSHLAKNVDFLRAQASKAIAGLSKQDECSTQDIDCEDDTGASK